MMWTIAGMLVTLIVLYVLYTVGSSLFYQEPVIGTFKQTIVAGSGLPVAGDTITFNDDHTFVNHRYGGAGSTSPGNPEVTGTWSKESLTDNNPGATDSNRSAYVARYKSVVPAGNQYLLTYDIGQGAVCNMEYVAINNGKLTFFAPLDVNASSCSLLYPSYAAFTKQ
jgi:hypothetical protein